MTSKYEIIEIHQCEITVDVSLLAKSGELFFNATDIAKKFDKQVKDFLKTNPTQEYIASILKRI